jgi:hypothetical protein
MKSAQESRPQTTQFGANPKKITCQCNAEEINCEVITIQMNSRCPACNSPYRISIPKSTIKGLQPQQQQSSLIDIERRMLLPIAVNAELVYRSSDWETGVLAL